MESFWPTALQFPAVPCLPSRGAAPGNDGAVEERAVPAFWEIGDGIAKLERHMFSQVLQCHFPLREMALQNGNKTGNK